MGLSNPRIVRVNRTLAMPRVRRKTNTGIGPASSSQLSSEASKGDKRCGIVPSKSMFRARHRSG